MAALQSEYAGYVTFQFGSELKIEHNIRDKEYMKKEMENFYSKPENKNRTFHIDPNLTKYNKVLVHHNIEDVYKEIYQPAVDKYDEKEKKKHPDRVKGDYYKYICSHQNEENAPKPLYEILLQYGDRNITSSPKVRKRCAEALEDYVSHFEQLNPHFKIVGAYLHMDEASPHVHLDVIPVATSERGLTVKNSRSLALKQQEKERLEEIRIHSPEKAKEYEKKIKEDKWSDNPLIRWEDKERDDLRAVAKMHGLECEIEPKETDAKHLKSQLYGLVQSVKELEAKEKRIKRQIDINLKNNELFCKEKINNAEKEAEKIKQDAEKKARKIIKDAEKKKAEIEQETFDLETKKFAIETDLKREETKIKNLKEQAITLNEKIKNVDDEINKRVQERLDKEVKKEINKIKEQVIEETKQEIYGKYDDWYDALDEEMKDYLQGKGLKDLLEEKIEVKRSYGMSR